MDETELFEKYLDIVQKGVKFAQDNGYDYFIFCPEHINIKGYEKSYIDKLKYFLEKELDKLDNMRYYVHTKREDLIHMDRRATDIFSIVWKTNE